MTQVASDAGVLVAGAQAMVLPLPPRLLLPVIDRDSVKVRREVTAGETIVAPGTSAAVIAPVAGIVRGIVDVQLTNRRSVPAAELEVTGPRAVDVRPAEKPVEITSLGQLSERVLAAGISADRHTCPDLTAQLHAAMKRPLELVICNGLEADRAALNHELVRTDAESIVAALGALGRAGGAGRVIIAVEPPVARRMSRAVRHAKPATSMRVVDLPNHYPQPDPTILIYLLTGRRLRPGRLPVEVGVLMIDVAAATAIGRSLTTGIALTHVPISIRHRDRSTNVIAAVGTPLRFALERLGITANDITVRAGPVLRDIRINPDAIISGDGELCLDISPSQPAISPSPCVRCGWCVTACPTRIHPAGLLEAAQLADEDLAERYGLHACIECGICSYVCPSRLPLLESIRRLRAR